MTLNLDNWYISQGLPTTGSSINCLFEDQLYWKIDTFQVEVIIWILDIYS